MLHSENMFPLLEPGGCDLVAEMMTAALSLSLSVVIMASGLQLEVNVLVTDDTFTPHGNLHFIELVVTH